MESDEFREARQAEINYNVDSDTNISDYSSDNNNNNISLEVGYQDSSGNTIIGKDYDKECYKCVDTVHGIGGYSVSAVHVCADICICCGCVRSLYNTTCVQTFTVVVVHYITTHTINNKHIHKTQPG